MNITPEFTAPLSDVISDEGNDVCLRCMVTGIPEPTVEWLCDNNVCKKLASFVHAYSYVILVQMSNAFI